jgi:hypothetical protein
MKHMGLRLLVALGASVAIGAFGLTDRGFAQDSGSTTGRSGRTEATLAPGSTILAELNSSVDSKKAKAGDPITAHTSEALKSSDDRLIMPKGTKIEGRITQATARNKGDNKRENEAALGIQFDKAVLKDGGEIPLNVIIQALAAPVSYSAPSDLGTSPRVGTTQTSPMRNAPNAPPGAQIPSAGDEPESRPNSSEQAPSQALDAKSRGVIGLRGITLNAEPANNRPASVVVSNGKSVHLDGGTRMLLVVQAAGSEPSGR